MFDSPALLRNDTRVFASTAASAEESSWGTFCPPDSDTVNGLHVGSCLGDSYAVNLLCTIDAACTWCDADAAGAAGCCAETVSAQLVNITAATTLSSVQIFGDVATVGPRAIGAFVSDYTAAAARSSALPTTGRCVPPTSQVSSRGAARASLVARLPATAAALAAADAKAATFTRAFDAFARALLGAPSARGALAAAPWPRDFSAWDCLRAGHAALQQALGRFDDRALELSRLVAAACVAHNESTVVRVAAAAAAAAAV